MYQFFSDKVIENSPVFAEVLQDINELFYRYNCPEMLVDNDDTTTGNYRKTFFIDIETLGLSYENENGVYIATDAENQTFIDSVVEINNQAAFFYNSVNCGLDGIFYYYVTDEFAEFSNDAFNLLEDLRIDFDLSQIN